MALLDWMGTLLRRLGATKREQAVAATRAHTPPVRGSITITNTTTGVYATLEFPSLISFASGGREIFRITPNNEVEFNEDMATPEGKVKARVLAMLKAFAPDVWWTFPLTGGFGNSGTPDILACCWGHFLAIECKAGNNTPTALQQREIDAIITAGGAAIVINESNLENLAVLLAAWNPHHERS